MTTLRKQTFAASFGALFFAVLMGGSMTATAQMTNIWANANVQGVTTNLDWFAGGTNTQGAWIDGNAPVGSANTDTISIFENNTATFPTTTASTLNTFVNNGGNPVELGTLKLTGRMDYVSRINIYISGDPLLFSGATATITSDVSGHSGYNKYIYYYLNNDILLGTASSPSDLSITGPDENTTDPLIMYGAVTEQQAGGGSKFIQNGGRTRIDGKVTVSGGLEINGGILSLRHSANAITGGIVLNGGVWNNVKTTDINNNLMMFNGPFTMSGGWTSTNEIVLNGGNLSITSGWTMNGPITLNTNNLTLANGAFTINASITGSGGVTVSAGGSGSTSASLNSTNNTFMGALVLSGGRDNNVNIASLGDAPGTGNVRFTEAHSFYHAFNFTGASPLILNHRQFVIANKDDNRIRNQSSQAFSVNTDLSVTVTNALTLTLGGTGTGLSTFAGNIGNGDSTALAVTKIESGTWVLSGTNTYSGTTTVSAGTLAVSGDFSLPHAGTLNIAGGKVEIVDRAGVAELRYAGGDPEAPGTYGSSASRADNPDDVRFSGTGILYVGVPFPPSGTVLILR